MRIWLYSTHASEEFNLVRMWLNQGFLVTGVFDCYSKQRPKIAGVTDAASIPGKEEGPQTREKERVYGKQDNPNEEWSEIVNRDRDLNTTSVDMSHFGVDFYVLMETTDRSARARHYAEMGLPVALQCFGQESVEEDEKLVPVLKRYNNIHVVCYSEQVRDRYAAQKVPYNQLHVIRFGLYLDEYRPWIGDISMFFCAHNSIHRRGKGCGWPEFKAIANCVPHLLAGNETEQVGGLGELTYESLKMLYRRSCCYLAMGTVPAPYTLTPVEAMATGCPIVFWDNGAGIAKEPFALEAGLVSGDIGQVRDYITKVLLDKVDEKQVEDLHYSSLAAGEKYFNAAKQELLWRQLFTSCQT